MSREELDLELWGRMSTRFFHRVVDGFIQDKGLEVPGRCTMMHAQDCTHCQMWGAYSGHTGGGHLPLQSGR